MEETLDKLIANMLTPGVEGEMRTKVIIGALIATIEEKDSKKRVEVEGLFQAATQSFHKLEITRRERRQDDVVQYVFTPVEPIANYPIQSMPVILLRIERTGADGPAGN